MKHDLNLIDDLLHKVDIDEAADMALKAWEEETGLNRSNLDHLIWINEDGKLKEHADFRGSYSIPEPLYNGRGVALIWITGDNLRDWVAESLPEQDINELTEDFPAAWEAIEDFKNEYREEKRLEILDTIHENMTLSRDWVMDKRREEMQR